MDRKALFPMDGFHQPRTNNKSAKDTEPVKNTEPEIKIGAIELVLETQLKDDILPNTSTFRRHEAQA